MAIEHEVAIKPDILFAEHDGVKLLGDLYLPKVWARPRRWSLCMATAGSSATANSTALGQLSRQTRLRRLLNRIPADEARPEDLAGCGRRLQGGGAVCAREGI
jgi:hypothetical protein